MDAMQRQQQTILASALKEAATDKLANDSSSSEWLTEEFRTIMQTADRETGHDLKNNRDSPEELLSMIILDSFTLNVNCQFERT